MALKDYPELKEVFDKLMGEKESIRAQSAPLRAERDALLQKMAPLVEREREIIRKIAAIERPRLAEIDSTLSRIAASTGGLLLNGKKDG